MILGKSKMTAICPWSNNKLISFLAQERQIYIFDVYYMVLRYARHSGVVRKKFPHCIVGKNPGWPPFVQGQAINSYHFRHNRGRFVFLVSIMGFSGMPYIVVLFLLPMFKIKNGTYLHLL